MQNAQNRRRGGRSQGQSNPPKTINYDGVVINPGNRTGKNRRNFIKRKKAQIKFGGNQGGGSNQVAIPSNRSRPSRGIVNASRTGVRQTPNNLDNRVSLLAPEAKATALKEYFACLLDPFYARSAARVPSSIPYPSSIITLRYQGTTRPNALGNICFQVSPQQGLNQWREFLGVINAPNYGPGNRWFGTDALPEMYGMVSDRLTANDMSKWRVVGAGLRVSYVGRQDTKSGYFMSAFVPEPRYLGLPNDPALAIAQPGAGANVAGTLWRGFSPDTMTDQYFNTKSYLHNDPSAECIWIPREDTDLTYIDLGGERNTSQMVICGFGLPYVQGSLEWEVVIHAEYLPAYTNKVVPTELVEAVPNLPNHIQEVYHQAPEYITSTDDGSDLSARIRRAAINTIAGVADYTKGILKEYVTRGKGYGYGQLMYNQYGGMTGHPYGYM